MAAADRMEPALLDDVGGQDGPDPSSGRSLKIDYPLLFKPSLCTYANFVFLCHMLNLEAGMLWPDDDSVPLDEDDQSNSMKKMAKMDPTLLDDTSLTKQVFRYVLLKWIVPFYLKLACCILMLIVFLCHMLNLEAGMLCPDASVPQDEEDGHNPPRWCRFVPGCLHVCPFRWITHFYLNLSCSILMLIVFLSYVKPWSWNAVARRWLCAPWWRRSIKLNEEDGKDGPNPPWWYRFDQACLQVCPFRWISLFYLNLSWSILMLIVFLCHMLNPEAGMLCPDASVPQDEEDGHNPPRWCRFVPGCLHIQYVLSDGLASSI